MPTCFFEWLDDYLAPVRQSVFVEICALAPDEYVWHCRYFVVREERVGRRFVLRDVGAGGVIQSKSITYDVLSESIFLELNHPILRPRPKGDAALLAKLAYNTYHPAVCYKLTIHRAILSSGCSLRGGEMQNRA